MATLTKPFTFTGGTYAVGSQVNSNFDTLFNCVNTNLIWADASRAFTATPSGPGSDPVSANQLSRATYTIGNGLANGVMYKAQFGQANLSPDGSGNANITYAHAFPTAVDIFLANVISGSGNSGCTVQPGSINVSSCQVHLANADGSNRTTSLSVYYLVIGH